MAVMLGCRGSSIKTRIETSTSTSRIHGHSQVAEVVPLKQGLKHNTTQKNKNKYLVAEVVPLKQGLKLPPF